jgi:hypothetical protein
MPRADTMPLPESFDVFKEGVLVESEVSQKFGISEFQQKAPIH